MVRAVLERVLLTGFALIWYSKRKYYIFPQEISANPSAILHKDIIPIHNRLLHTKHGSPFTVSEIETTCAQYADFLDLFPI